MIKFIAPVTITTVFSYTLWNTFLAKIYYITYTNHREHRDKKPGNFIYKFRTLAKILNNTICHKLPNRTEWHPQTCLGVPL